MKKTKVFTLILLWILSCSIFFQFSIPVKSSPAYEDFTTYTETGDSGEMLSQNTTHANWTHLDRNYNTWAYKDYGNGFFSGDLEHTFDFEVTELDGGDYDERTFCQPFTLSEQAVSGNTNPDDFIGFYLAQETTSDIKFWISFFHMDGGDVEFNVNSHSDPRFDVGTIYYVLFERIGTDARLRFYSDAERTSIFWDSGNQTCVTDSYRYVTVTRGFDYANDPNDWSSGYLRNLFLSMYSVIFYFNEGGQFRVNNSTMTNGTQETYIANTVLELVSIPQNSTYMFSHFQWDSTNSTTNFYNLTVTSNFTVWCYFDFPPAVQRGEYIAVLLAISFIFIPLLICVVWAARRRK